jgi:hypothetical protein
MKQRKDSASVSAKDTEANSSIEESTSAAQSSSASLFSGLARTVTSGGKSLLQNLGMMSTNKRLVQIDYLKKVLHGLEY